MRANIGLIFSFSCARKYFFRIPNHEQIVLNLAPLVISALFMALAYDLQFVFIKVFIRDGSIGRE